MILAGYETTANALGFTLYLLAANSGAQDRLTAEVDAVLGAGRHASYQDLERMPYMDACLREGLRHERHPQPPACGEFFLLSSLSAACMYRLLRCV